jgi:hypothetical protein
LVLVALQAQAVERAIGVVKVQTQYSELLLLKVVVLVAVGVILITIMVL